MTDPKTLREIADQACIFDRTHFDDDTAPTPEALVENHGRLPSDRKLITRLRPRHAVALGYFEGYAKAAEIASEMRRNIKEQIGAEPNRNLFGALTDLVKERDELRERVTYPASVEEIFHAIRNEIRQFGESEESISDRQARSVWLLLRRKGDAVGKEEQTQANIGIVKKPPPPPPPATPPKPEEISDELVQAAADYANSREEMSIPKPPENVREAMTLARNMRSLWGDAAVDFVAGAQWQSKREDELRTLLERTESERLAMKEERDRALAKVRAWEARTEETQPRIVESKLSVPSDEAIGAFVHLELYKGRNWTDREIAYTADLLREDEAGLLRGATMYNGYRAEACAIKLAFMHFMKPDESRLNEEQTIAGKALVRVRNTVDLLPYNLGGVPKPSVMKAIDDELAELRETDANDDVQAGSRGLSLDECIRRYGQSHPLVREYGILKTLNEWQGDEIERLRKATIPNVAEPRSFIVFRDNNERDFWDEEIHALNRRDDRSARDVASAADEMVEERRKRMPIRTVSEVAKTDASNDVLQMACAYANREMKFSASANDLVYAREALAGTGENGAWDSIVRAYVEGSSRKT